MDLEVFIKSHNPVIAVETVEEDRLEKLLERLAWRLNLPLFIWDCYKGLVRCGQDNAIYQTSEPVAALSAVGEISTGIFFLKDLKPYLEDHRVRRVLRDIAGTFTNRKTIVFLAGGSDFSPDIQEILIDCPLPLPTKGELGELLDKLLAAMPGVRSRLTEAETNRVLENLRGLTAYEAKRALSQAVITDGLLDKNDIQLTARAKKKFVEKDNLVSYISPEDNLEVVGGLDNLKAWIKKRKTAFEQNRANLPAPKGVMLIGVPGCGKTLCARAIAHELGIGMIKLDPGRLYNKYIGESEANLRRVLRLAESLAPVVLLVDEVEKVLPNVDVSTSDGGLAQRMFGAFLSWLQDKTAPVFIVATSNNIQALPPELTRKGRFDEIFFVDLPNAAERKNIFGIHLKRRNIDPAAVDVDELARLTDGFSGAEIEEAILSALYSVVSGAGVISTDLIKTELARTIPLSRREAARTAQLRQWATANTIRA